VTLSVRRAGQKLWSSKERQQSGRAAVTGCCGLETACYGYRGMSGVLRGSNGAGAEDLAAVLDFTTQGLLTAATAERVNDMARPPRNWRCDRGGIARIAPNRARDVAAWCPRFARLASGRLPRR